MADSLLDLLTPSAGAFGGGKMNQPMMRTGLAMMQPGALNPMALAQAANPQQQKPQQQCASAQPPIPGQQPVQTPSPYPSMMIGRQAY